MAIKITDKILSIPPYISTSWSRVATLHMKGDELAISLINGSIVHIPNLQGETINLIFLYHSLYLEKEHTMPTSQDLSKLKNVSEQIEPSIRVAFGSSLENLGNIMQHNPNQADSPDLPSEILQKIGAIAKVMGTADDIMLPKAEQGCNCFHCQIARALHPVASNDQNEEAIVSEEELKFQQWTIMQTGDKLFSVINRLDEHEKYHVFLGEPVGCTCGKQGCEHILAVLKS